MATGTVTLAVLAFQLQQAANAGIVATLAQVATETATRAQDEVRRLVEARLTVRSRSLLTSVRADLEIQGPLARIAVRAGGNHEGLRVPYGLLQEEGGTIRPKKRYLAIPVGPALNPVGNSRFPSPRDVPGLAFAQTKGGQPVLLKGSGPNAGTVWYLLRRSVTVPAHHFVRDGVAAVTATLPAELAERGASAVEGR